jgi:2-methylisocitrate lyase-like PEP mutase family enzyme
MQTKKKSRVMRELLAKKKIILSPGVYDGYSARLVEMMGFSAASTTGSGLAHSALGVPDVGIMDLTSNVEACRRLARAISIPLMADADTGYGNAITVGYTVRSFEDAGVVGINIEDQLWPKRCGHLQGKEIIDSREMTKKIEAAVAARNDPDFIIVARTDAIAVEGIEGAISRVKDYEAAGADLIYPDSIRSESDIERIVAAVRVPVSIGMGFGIRERRPAPLISVKRLGELGVARVCTPRLLPGAAVMAMKMALNLMNESASTGNVFNREDIIAGMSEIAELMGYERYEKLESEYLLHEQLDKKYAGKSPKFSRGD